MTGTRQGRRADLRVCAAALAVFLAGCTGPAGPETSDATAPTPAPAPSSASPTTTAPATPGTAAPSAPGPEQPPVLTASPPVSLRIPATGTDSELLHLGLRDNGSLKVPPEAPGSPASWYTGSPTPGERGPAVLLGHVNATGGGPGVFADLRSLVAGDTVEITRADGSTAVFAVDRGEQYTKDDFPTLEVYGNTVGAELRLITCDGYDPATGTFDDNYVVYAGLVTDR